MSNSRPWCDMPDSECRQGGCDGRGCALSKSVGNRGHLVAEWIAEKWRDDLVKSHERHGTGGVLRSIVELLTLIDAEREMQLGRWIEDGIEPFLTPLLELRKLQELLASLDAACNEAAFRIDGADWLSGPR